MGALASCTVALDHIGQRAVATASAAVTRHGQEENEDEPPRVALGLCLLLIDHLLPLCESGEDDLLRSDDSDSGRAMTKRECVLLAEALRNLCLLGPMLCEHRPGLAPALLRLSSSLTTSYRLRGAVLEALSRLTATAAHEGSLGLATDTLVQRLVDARFVTSQ